ncbi:MAG: TetR/AcrR family transcriptional regulator [Alphaproteobacteria bacterium]|nr:TetR/AcrR family transcriptional regulator [Alphaproteobacteria bacterium]MBV9371106.1 TetR/AcrR family transcriptional regulator [Alphaproteobacteria bacterium]MBV9901520.1 TetR/AcrR family transcriptional regulator [Alphaproteobacteria bacterium]
MRTRSEEKRREIVRVAARAFEELGYERTSMLTIAERFKGSKQTLYNYFPSKEELLRAVLDFDVSEIADKALEEFRAEKDLRKALVRLGIVFLNGQLAPAAISNIRIVATQPAESTLGGAFYQNVLKPAWERAAAAFESLMDEGKLRKADPWRAAMHWKGLVLSDLFERRLLGAMAEPDPQEIESTARQAADAFLRIYAPDAPD